MGESGNTVLWKFKSYEKRENKQKPRPVTPCCAWTSPKREGESSPELGGISIA